LTNTPSTSPPDQPPSSHPAPSHPPPSHPAVEVGATVKALQTGLASTVAAAPLLAVANAVGVALGPVGIVATPILLGAAGAFAGYQMGRHVRD